MKNTLTRTNNPDREDGELDKDEINKSEKSNDNSETYMKRLSTKEWASRNADLYTKVDQVGEGTFGKVFKALYKTQNKSNKNEHVALKRILMDNEKEGFPITAIREIMILKRLNHPNIIKLIEIVTSKPNEGNKFRGNVYLVFEYMEHDISGLADIKLSFTVPMIKCILHQLLSGVEYLHSNNIIHRDIKGANILLNNKGEVKIADFGLARIINPNPSITKQYTNRVVTLWYRSPELLLGATNYGPSIDMWSVGCVFSELLTGVPPFKGQKESDQLEKIFEKCGTPTEEAWPEVTGLKYYNQLLPRTVYPSTLRAYYSDNKKVDDVAFDLLSRMLQLDPNKRITAQEALNHKYFKDHLPLKCSPDELPKIGKDSHEFQSRKEKQQKNPQQEGNNKPIYKNEGGMIVAKQAYQHQNNPHYYSKNSTQGSQLFEAKLKKDDYPSAANLTQGGSRLEMLLLPKKEQGEEIFLNNKRYAEPNQEVNLSLAHKKQRKNQDEESTPPPK